MHKKAGFRNILVILLVTAINSCSHDDAHLFEKYYGIYIDHSLRQGSGYSDSTGKKYWYFYVKTIITNDSTIPVHVKLNFPSEIYRPSLADDQQYKVFLLTDSMITSNEFKDYYLISGEIKKLFDSGFENPVVVDTVLEPEEKCTVYICFITPYNNGMSPYLSLISRGHKPHFWPSKTKFRSAFTPSDSILSIPDSALNKYILPEEKQLNLFLGVSILNSQFRQPPKYYNIIPCGQVSYSDF